MGRHANTRFLSVALICSACASLFAIHPATSTAFVAAPHERQAGHGGLVVQVAGLPRRAQGEIVITGPARPARAQRFRRELQPSGVARLEALRPGSYQLSVREVRMKVRSGAIRAGAVAYPVKRHYRVAVRAHRNRTIRVRYGSIVNPGVRSATGRIASVVGDPLAPSAIVMKSTRGVRRGTVLSAKPGARLPRGLLARVTSIARQPDGFMVSLGPVDVYEVAPNLRFDIPLQHSRQASDSRLLNCGIRGPDFNGYASVDDLRLSGGWTTSKVGFVTVKTGADVALRFLARAGITFRSAVAASCSVPLPVIALQGMAGPIPVYGGIRPRANAQAGAGISLHTGGSTAVTLGTRIGGLPPSASPYVKFDSPRFALGLETFASATASLGLDAEVGIGAANAANLHAAFGNSLDFSATPGSCTWHLNMGSFSAGGQLGPFSISTPVSPALYHRKLWQERCGSPPPPADVIQGSWDFPGIGTIRIDPTGTGTFQGVAVTDITFQYTSCVLTPAGQVVWPTIRGTGGSYRGNVYWANVTEEGCHELGADPEGSFSVDDDTMTVCSTEPGGFHSGCFDGYRRR